ncbi:MAG: PilW family protein, partial [Pseudomonadota bacterium]
DGDAEIQDDEFIRYALNPDTNNDGVADSFPCSLGRETGVGTSASGLQPVADNVQAIEFNYHLDNGTATLNASSAKIQSVDVSLLVRTGRIIRGYRDTKLYFPASNTAKTSSGKKWGPFNDSYRRKLLTTNIKSRNMVWTISSK